MKLKDAYILANCCTPTANDTIIGYFSYDNVIKVHRSGCANLARAAPARLMSLEWPNIIAEPDFRPDDDFDTLDGIDIAILKHHQELGVDYSLKVAAMLHMDRQTVFDRHRSLREMGLLERVKPVMMQYRKNVVKNRWIKHRNHTYYELTEKGKKYLAYYIENH
ncbi:MAG: DUF2250 domain-containing protein [Candidatus Zixiibacteriota bacterium]|nr:MAG: DUF2250 domain-containing protein [candidate division Zixibacteria bacterium]